MRAIQHDFRSDERAQNHVPGEFFSGGGGAVAGVAGETKCKDGTPLSDKRENKGCNTCGKKKPKE